MDPMKINRVIMRICIPTKFLKLIFIMFLSNNNPAIWPTHISITMSILNIRDSITKSLRLKVIRISTSNLLPCLEEEVFNIILSKTSLMISRGRLLQTIITSTLSLLRPNRSSWILQMVLPLPRLWVLPCLQAIDLPLRLLGLIRVITQVVFLVLQTKVYRLLFISRSNPNTFSLWKNLRSSSYLICLKVVPHHSKQRIHQMGNTNHLWEVEEVDFRDKNRINKSLSRKKTYRCFRNSLILMFRNLRQLQTSIIKDKMRW